MTIASYNELLPGTSIRGRWNKCTYLIERKLGEGSNGRVYLVVTDETDSQTRYALKVGFGTSDIQSEINLLRKLAPIVNKNPFFIDADDYLDGEEFYSFYVMQYVEGISMSEFIEQKGSDWLYLTGYYLLDRLVDIHKQGFAFCDIKPSNVVVSEYGLVELIDYGGASRFGQSIRQYTELYDRGFWNCGSRESDSAYDLFAFAILFMQIAGTSLPSKEELAVLLPQNRSKAQLYRALKNCEACHPVSPVLLGMINGTYTDSKKSLEHWRNRMHKIGIAPRQTIRIPWIGGLAVVSALLLTISLYVTLN